ncbi:MAG: hypothetical protein ACR2KU_14930 [Gammaproteobacteria bacterium]
MGIFDVPAPLFAWLDSHANSFASPTLRIILWALVSAVISMGLYWLLSPQQRIADVKRRALEARRALDAYDGEFAGAWPRISEMLRLSLKQVGIVTMPAVLASLPILCVLVWLSTTYGHVYPSDYAQVDMRAYPQGQVQPRWSHTGDARDEGAQGRASNSNVPIIELVDNRQNVLDSIPLKAPVTTIHKRQWWNSLFGNPAGYLSPDERVEGIEIDLPSQEVLGFGPGWMRSWEFLFFVVLLIASIAIKVIFRIK